MRPIVFAVLAILLCCRLAAGQEFEAASVKPVALDRRADHTWRGGPGTEAPGQLTCPQVSFWTLLQRAYGLEPEQISGPSWMRDEWYSIAAKIPPNTTQEDFRLMLQHLLAGRFHLAAHIERRDAPGYELVVASGGPKLKPAADPPVPPERPAAAKLDEDSFPPLPPGRRSQSMIFGQMVRSSHRETMAELAGDLGGMIGMSAGVETASFAPRVVDRTGLTGRFEFHLEYAASPGILRYTPPQPPGDAASDPANGGPTVFTALERQLGLKLLKTRNVPLEILVVDRAEKVPDEN